MKIVTILFAAALAMPAAAYAQAAGDYPPCSATVTDHCMQHEGGGSWGRHHHMMRHHRHHHG